MAAENYANNFSTTLNGAIDNAQTSLVVASVSGAPATGPFRVIVDNEIMVASGTLTGPTWTVARGQEGTAAVTHANGATVKHDLTAGMMQGFAQTSVLGTGLSPAAAYGTLTTGAAGTAWTETDGLTDPFIAAAAGIKLSKLNWNSQSVTAATTLVDASAPVIRVNLSAPATVNLPPTATDGTVFLFQDIGGTGATNNITIGRNGANINGGTTNPVINTNYGMYGVISMGGAWYVFMQQPASVPSGSLYRTDLNESLWQIGTPTTGLGLGYLGATGDPAMTTGNATATSQTLYTGKLHVPKGGTLNFVDLVQGGAGTLTTVATGSTQAAGGTQTAPGSGSWTLTTVTNPGGYPANGWVTIGGKRIYYSAWTTTSMTVAAGGYTPGDTFAQATAITLNTNMVAVFTSAGVLVDASVDQTAVWNSVGYKQMAMPFLTTIAAGDYYVQFLSTGGTPAKMNIYSPTGGATNAAGQSGALNNAAARWGTNGTAQASMGNSITPSSITNNNANAYFMGLS